jgi:hypothetical protein
MAYREFAVEKLVQVEVSNDVRFAYLLYMRPSYI